MDVATHAAWWNHFLRYPDTKLSIARMVAAYLGAHAKAEIWEVDPGLASDYEILQGQYRKNRANMRENH